MTPDEAVALRKPFEKHGLLPKPYKRDAVKGNCNECGSYHGMPAAHIPYVGHAAVTDRLLSIDPQWNWEPVALDDQGLPAFTTGKGLWIRLTVCGVTRLGFGDGLTVKECIGDAIRNAAMRFGVALDLWGKEELEQANGPVQTAAAPAPAASETGSVTAEAFRQTEPQKVEPRTAEPAPAPKLTAKQRSTLFATFGKKGIPEEQQLPGIAHIIGRTPEHRDELTADEFQSVMAALDSQPDVEGSE